MRVVYLLVAMNVLLFAIGWQMPLDGANAWSYIGYSFSHANWLHLTFNMLALLTFGLGVERECGEFDFLLIYFGAVICGAAVQGLQPMVGASAGVFGLLAVYGVLFPRKMVLFFFVPMSARVLVWGYLLTTVVMALMGWMPQVAHWAHIGGAAFGIGWVLAIRERDV